MTGDTVQAVVPDGIKKSVYLGRVLMRANGDLVISYNVNAGASADLLYADTYRPRFIRIPTMGLIP
jgi:hypothetical protein